MRKATKRKETATPASRPKQKTRTSRTSRAKKTQDRRTKTPAQRAKGTRTVASRATRATNGAALRSSTAKAPTKKTVTSKKGSAKSRTVQSSSQRGSRGRRKKPLILRVFIGVLATCLLAFITVCILALTPLFTIENIEYIASAHVSSEDIAQLAQIPNGATLLSLNPFAINAHLRKNPWVETAHLERIFPSTLKVSVSERDILALVEVEDSSVAWYVSTEKTWIEPATLPAAADASAPAASTGEAILNLARTEHILLIKDIPEGIAPKAGEKVSDAEILGVFKLREGFSSSFNEQIAVYSAPNTNSYTATLTHGVTVFLGDTSDIASKEAVAQKLLEKYPAQLTYINVKNPANPTFRKIEH